MEKLFKLQENGTTVKTELLAGLTTFMTMAYIIALNPNLLTNFAVGTPLWNGVFLATCIASAIGTICMAFMANKPFVMAPGMGLNSFFAVVVANIAVINNCEYESAFQAGLVIILVEGIVFLVLTLLKVREKIVEAIPLGVRYGIAPAIGLMLMNIGLGSNVGIYAEGNGFTSPFYIMRDFFGALTPSIIKGSMGDIGYHTMVLTAITAFLGVFVMVVLAKKGIKAAVLLGMLFSSVLYWIGSFAFLGVNPFASLETASFVPPFADMVSTTLFKFDFAGFVNIGWFTAITLIITFCMIDMFDTIGTLYGACSKGDLLDENGTPIRMEKMMLADAIATCAGAVAGTSTVTTFVESSAGVAAGGKTGFTSLVTGICFIIAMFLSPIAQLVPRCATATALIWVGVLMMSSVAKVDWSDAADAIVAFMTFLGMLLGYSISKGIGMGIITFIIVRVCTGKIKEISVPTWVIGAIFLATFLISSV